VVEQWKKQIAAQKNAIANTQDQIAELKVTIISIDPSFATHSRETEDYAGMSYNYRLAKQLARLHTMEVQLAQQRQRLDEMQETARHAGMHTLTYDP
jgi:septal ring factor EnvC (AmiA/AmiB activator)